MATAAESDSFDSSVSVKWSSVGFNRTGAVEFLFFNAPEGNYNATILYYGRLN